MKRRALACVRVWVRSGACSTGDNKTQGLALVAVGLTSSRVGGCSVCPLVSIRPARWALGRLVRMIFRVIRVSSFGGVGGPEGGGVESPKNTRLCTPEKKSDIVLGR